jgi:polysaccharide deacetylase 2 family uncharacterized protein YibQ
MAIRKPERRAPPRQRAFFSGALLSGQARQLRLPLIALAAVAAIAIIAVQLLGDPSAAGPRRVVALSPQAGASDAAPRMAFSDAVAPVANLPLDDLRSDDAPRRGSEPASAGDDAGDPGQIRISVVDAPAARRAPTPLARAPIAGLTEPGPMGPLPIVARDGRTPAQVYARAFAADRRPKIAIIVGGLGFNARTTTQAIDELPPEITLSFVPYASRLQAWVDRARAGGHEVMLELPMEPFDPAADDTGPQTLLASATATQNQQRLENLLSRASGYFGVTNYQGARFAASAQASAPLVQALRRRGLVFFTSGIGQRTALSVEAGRAGLPMAAADRIVDARRDAAAISEQLLNLEALAQQSGTAIGAGFAYPVTMEQIETWASEIGVRGFALAPVSAVLNARTQSR